MHLLLVPFLFVLRTLANPHADHSLLKEPPTDTSSAFPPFFLLVNAALPNTRRIYSPDFLHEGITRFLGGRLSLAEFGNPKRILEVG